MAKALQDMEEDEFMAAWDKAGEEAQEAKKRLREFSEEHDRRLTQASLEKRLAGMSDREREALAQYVGPVGIESEEAVHTS